MKPKKSLGQNFLTDTTVLAKIIETAELKGDETVVEVGGGKGILTSALSDELPNGKVICLEFDQPLAYQLERGLGKRKNISVIHTDALKFDWENLPKGYKVVANLPYQITSPLLNLWTFQLKNQPSSMTLMVQKEVAQRLTAEPGSAKRGLTTILVELYGEAEYIQTVPAKSFFPIPKVDSAIIKIQNEDLKSQNHNLNLKIDKKAIIKVAKAGFSAKRRTLSNSLSGSLGLPKDEINDILVKAEISPERRAETLTIKEWEILTYSIKSNLKTQNEK